LPVALKSGAIDASEWVGPWLDMELGLHRAADYYYYPGFHEPGTNSTLGINKTLWDGPDAFRARADRSRCRSRGDAIARRVQRRECQGAQIAARPTSGSRFLRYNDALIRTFGKLSKEVLADTAAKDPLTRKVYDSYMGFLAGVMDWGELSETGYRDTRRLALG